MAHTSGTTLVLLTNSGTSYTRANMSDVEVINQVFSSPDSSTKSIALTTTDDNGDSVTITFARAKGDSQNSTWTPT